MTPPYIPEIQEKSQKFQVSFTERELVRMCCLSLTEVLRVPPLPSGNGPQPLTWTRATPSSHAIIRLWRVHSCCSPAAAVFESWHVLCSLCFFFFVHSFFLRKNTGRALQCAGAVMHNSSSEHSTAVGHTRYSAAPAQPYNFDAAPAQQYSPRVSPPPTRWPDRNNSRTRWPDSRTRVSFHRK